LQFNFKVHVDFDPIKKIEGAKKRVERILAEQVRKDTSPFVPMLTGSLDNRTKVEGTEVIYPGPYARYLYYGKVMVDPNTGSPVAPKYGHKVVTNRPLDITTNFHSQAQAFWFEASKAQNLEKWERVAKKAIDRELRMAP
jgi:hypothetical protein